MYVSVGEFAFLQAEPFGMMTMSFRGDKVFLRVSFDVPDAVLVDLG